MISADTNILFAALEESVPEHESAKSWLKDQVSNPEFVVAELVLVELYMLVRNPVVVNRPLTAGEATAVCQNFRRHPRWRVVEGAPVMSEVWEIAAHKNFARRKIIDARLALTLRHHGVTRFATVNQKHFKGFGFQEVLNPLS
jgi:hypothetical protein